MIESMAYEEAVRWCITYHAKVTFIGPTKIRVQAQGYKPVIGAGFSEAVALAHRTICEVPETEEEKEIATPLKEAIRYFWNASKLLEQAQAEDHDLFVIENRKEDVKRAEAGVEAAWEQVQRFVLTDSETCDWLNDPELIRADVDLLLNKGIIHDCLSCEERADLADCYGGDHREFHLSGDHQDACVLKALHENDPARWPDWERPTNEYDACAECGIVAVPC